MVVDSWAPLARLLMAAPWAVLGIERESRGHAAGTRTLALAAIGAARFTAVGSHRSGIIPFAGTSDAGRPAAQVVRGLALSAPVIVKIGGAIRGPTSGRDRGRRCDRPSDRPAPAGCDLEIIVHQSRGGTGTR